MSCEETKKGRVRLRCARLERSRANAAKNYAHRAYQLAKVLLLNFPLFVQTLAQFDLVLFLDLAKPRSRVLELRGPQSLLRLLLLVVELHVLFQWSLPNKLFHGHSRIILRKRGASVSAESSSALEEPRLLGVGRAHLVRRAEGCPVSCSRKQ